MQGFCNDCFGLDNFGPAIKVFATINLTIFFREISQWPYF
eukprot:13549.XXX_134037_134156_1 [CDS] Oithona nana genome sequencing.